MGTTREENGLLCDRYFIISDLFSTYHWVSSCIRMYLNLWIWFWKFNTFTFSILVMISLRSLEYCTGNLRNWPFLIFTARAAWLRAVKGGLTLEEKYMLISVLQGTLINNKEHGMVGNFHIMKLHVELYSSYQKCYLMGANASPHQTRVYMIVLAVISPHFV